MLERMTRRESGNAHTDADRLRFGDGAWSDATALRDMLGRVLDARMTVTNLKGEAGNGFVYAYGAPGKGTRVRPANGTP